MEMYYSVIIVLQLVSRTKLLYFRNANMVYEFEVHLFLADLLEMSVV
jgi:hypothetical protein